MSTARHIRQLGSDTAIYGIAGTIGRFIAIFLMPLYTRVLSTADYGIIGSLASLVGLLSTFIVLGLDSASSRWYYDTDSSDRRRRVISSWFWCQLAAGLVIAFVFILFAPQLSGLLLGSKDYALLVRLVALAIPLGTFGKVLGNWLRYQRRAWFTAAYFTANSLVTVGAIFLFVLLLRRGLEGLYQAQLIAAALMAAVAAFVLRSWIGPRRISPRILKEMLRFGLPLVPAAVTAWVTASSDRLILPFFQGRAETGIYTVAVSLSSAVALVTNAFQLAWPPFAFSILHEPGSEQVYGKVLSIYALVGSLLCTGVSLFAPLLLYILTTPQYYSAASCVPFLVFSYLALGGIYIVALGCNIVKKSLPIATSTFIGAGVNTALNFTLIPTLGKNGAAIATMVAYLSAVVYLYFTSQKHYPLPYRPRDVLICFGFSWLCIGIDRLFLPTWGIRTFVVRAAMCLLFIPLAFALDIVKPAHVRQMAEILARKWASVRHWRSQS